MSDSYFVGTIARVHKLWRYSATRADKSQSSIDEEVLKKLLAMDDEQLSKIEELDDADRQRLIRLRNGESLSKISEERELALKKQKDRERKELGEEKPEIGMMVSLDHTIYFHNPRRFRADEWMFTEMETPWSDDGRGLVFQRMFTRDGTLIATCVQEVSLRSHGAVALRYPLLTLPQGLIRLKQNGQEKPATKL